MADEYSTKKIKERNESLKYKHKLKELRVRVRIKEAKEELRRIINRGKPKPPSNPPTDKKHKPRKPGYGEILS